jgi:TRAP-type C4-dicarboxylate transport system permease large subunit
MHGQRRCRAFILAGPVYRQLSWRDVPWLLASVAMSSAAIIALIGFATFFGWALAFQQVPDMLVGVIERYAPAISRSCFSPR